MDWIHQPIEEDTDSAVRSEDEALVRRAKQNAAEFAPLYQRYVRAIYGFCYQRLRNRELAEDATSSVFTKALAALPRYRADSFRAWLYTIARNVVFDQQRRRPNASLNDAHELASAGASPEDHALTLDGDRNVQRLLSQLTSDQRDVVELRLAGLSSPEIAIVLGRRAGAIRAIQFRAYQRLRELVPQEGSRS